jgi:hypothetical protein
MGMERGRRLSNMRVRARARARRARRARIARSRVMEVARMRMMASVEIRSAVMMRARVRRIGNRVLMLRRMVSWWVRRSEFHQSMQDLFALGRLGL